MNLKLRLSYPVSANDYWRSFPYMGKEWNGHRDELTAALSRGDIGGAKRAFLQMNAIKPKAVTVPSKEAEAFKEEAVLRARVAGCREPSVKPVEISRITLHPRPNKDGSASAVVLDLDNVLKVLIDALKGVVYKDDKQIKRIRCVEYGEPVRDGAVSIEVIEFVPPPSPLFALTSLQLTDDGKPF